MFDLRGLYLPPYRHLRAIDRQNELRGLDLYLRGLSLYLRGLDLHLRGQCHNRSGANRKIRELRGFDLSKKAFYCNVCKVHSLTPPGFLSSKNSPVM